MNKELFIHNLRLLRSESGKKAQELSFDLNLNYHRISDIETNPKVHINEDEVAAIAEYFGFSVETITTKKAKIVFE